MFSVFCLSGGARGIRGIAILTSTVVLGGVVGMSIGGCSLFQEAYDDLGPALYILGTFAIHYFPWSVIVCTTFFGPSSDSKHGLIGPGSVIVSFHFSNHSVDRFLIGAAGGVSFCNLHAGQLGGR